MDLSQLANMFQGVEAFNQNISGWDVSMVQNMSYMFQGAKAFNRDISNWVVSNVTNMSHMYTHKLFNIPRDIMNDIPVR